MESLLYSHEFKGVQDVTWIGASESNEIKHSYSVDTVTQAEVDGSSQLLAFLCLPPPSPFTPLAPLHASPHVPSSQILNSIPSDTYLPPPSRRPHLPTLNINFHSTLLLASHSSATA